jgi:hypothetical protein
LPTSDDAELVTATGIMVNISRQNAKRAIAATLKLWSKHGKEE